MSWKERQVKDAENIINNNNVINENNNFIKTLFGTMVSNIINPLTEIEPTKISYEVKKIIDDYIVDVRTKQVNYNLHLQSTPKLIIEYLEELGYSARNRPSTIGRAIIFFQHLDNFETFIDLDLLIDYINFKCYLLNTSPAKINF